MKNANYASAIREAAELRSEDSENPEYDRGLYELIARMFPKEDIPTDDRALEVEADVSNGLPTHEPDASEQEQLDALNDAISYAVVDYGATDERIDNATHAAFDELFRA